MTRDPSTSYEGSVGIMSKQAGTLVQSATANTYGASVTVSPDAPNGAIHPDWLALVSTGTSTETVTMRATATYSDGSTASITVAATTDTTTAVAERDLRYVLQKDGVFIVSLALAAKSTDTSSVATLGYEFAGAV